MIIIAKTVKNMDMLISKAEVLLDEAIENKEEYPMLADAYYESYLCIKKSILTLHDNVVKFIREEATKDKDESILSVMKKIWSFEHSLYMEHMQYLENKEDKYKNL